MSGLNWKRDHDRRRMRSHGTEGARDEPLIFAGLQFGKRRPRQPPPTKEELRRQAAAAFMAWRRQQGR